MPSGAVSPDLPGEWAVAPADGVVSQASRQWPVRPDLPAQRPMAAEIW